MQSKGKLLIIFLLSVANLNGNCQNRVGLFEKQVDYSYYKSYRTLTNIDTTNYDNCYLIIKDSLTGEIKEINFWNLKLGREISIIMTRQSKIGTLNFIDRQLGLNYTILEFSEAGYISFDVQGINYFRSYIIENNRITHFSTKIYHVGGTVGRLLFRRRINKKVKREIDMVKSEAMNVMFGFINTSSSADVVKIK